MKLDITKEGVKQEIDASKLLKSFLLSDSRQLHLYEAGYDLDRVFIEWLGENQYKLNSRIYNEQLTAEFHIVLDEYHRGKND
jgi:hypothetical protein